MHRVPLCAVVSLALLVGCSANPEPTPAAEDSYPAPSWTAKNLLMISLDTTRKSFTSRYDPEGRDLTPFLAARMAEGLVAENQTTCSSWTFPSTACALSGNNALDLGKVPTLVRPEATPWDDSAVFLAERLGAVGFYSAFSVDNGWLFPLFGMTEDYTETAMLMDATATEITADGLALLDGARAEDPDRRWFLHLHFTEPHTPYTPPDEYLVGEEQLPPSSFDFTNKDAHYHTIHEDWEGLGDEERAAFEAHARFRYDAELRWLDDQLEAIWTDLDAQGLLDDTLVLVWSDHGEQFWEHGNQAHAYQLHPEENDVLFFAWGKGLEGRSVDRPTQQQDVAATALHLLGEPIPEEIDGVPLEVDAGPRVQFAELNGRIGRTLSVTKDHMKLIYGWDGTVYLFDTVSDPTEHQDLSATDPQTTAELWELLGPRVSEAASLLDGPQPTAPEGVTANFP